MSPEPIDEKAVFNIARRIDSREARADYLEQMCGADPDARRRVVELLQVHDEQQSFLESPAVAVQATLDEAPSERPGTQIGPYKLMEQIGEGGMGLVFVAEQHHPVRRKVALKLIKPGMDTRDVIARFEAERQALALMDHPNIAKVLDAGTIGGIRGQEPGIRKDRAQGTLAPDPWSLAPAGRPYFVMELVKGTPITQYCDEYRLSPRERLELFTDVCHAVQHAHQKGIIHRDIKPTNVLVASHDGKPVVKVIDFGVAKAIGQQLTERTIYTALTQMVGTPLYMSPEQAGMSSLDIDTRTDIYSLGVLLYELLTGTTPFDKERLKQVAYDEMRRIIREEEPQKPSTRISTADAAPSIAAQRNTEPARLAKLVRGDLDWIVMKALEKDRNRRYETANGFAQDVQRYLNDEAVQACPPSATYRFRKFARRNKAGLFTIATVAVALLAGTIISTWQAIRASRAEHSALVNFDRARGAVKRMLTRVAKEELIDVPWMEPVRQALLADALEFYEQLLAERSTDPEIRLATAEARIDLSWERPERWETIRSALEVIERLAEEFPENLRYRSALANALKLQSHEAAWTPKRWQEAEQLLRRAVKLQESVVSATPDSTEDAYALANILDLLGNTLRTGGQTQEAEAVYQRVVSMVEGISAKDPDHAGNLRAQIRGLTAIADLIRRKEPDRAEALLLRAQALAARLTARRITGDLLAVGAMTVANVDQVLAPHYEATGRPKEAEAAFRRAVAVYARHTTDFPGLKVFRERLAWTSENLARFLSGQDKREEAERMYREVIEMFEELLADFPTQSKYYSSGLARSYRGLAALLDATGRPEDADKALRQALTHFMKVGEDVPDHIDSRLGAARVSRQLAMRAQRAEDAEQLYRQALTLLLSIVGECPDVAEYRSTLADTYGRLATLLGDAGKFQEAEAAVRQAVAVFEKLAGEFPKQREYRQALATTYESRWVKIASAAGLPDEIDKAKRQALTVWQNLAADFPEEAHYRHKSGVLQHAFREYDNALASLTRAVELQGDSWEAWHWRGITLGALGQWEEAVADQSRALELKSDHAWSWYQRGLGHGRLAQLDKAIADHSNAIEVKPDFWSAYHERGWLHGKLGHWDKAIDDQTKALEVNPKHWRIWSRRGEGYSALKQWDKAIADYTQAIALGATEAHVWVSKAGAHAQLNQPEKAIADLRQAIAKGFRDVKQLTNRSDLATLRSRDDFKHLLSELEAKKK